MWIVELSPQPSLPGLITAKLNFERQFSRAFAVLCAMVAQNAYANGEATNQRRRGETRERKTVWRRGAIDFGGRYRGKSIAVRRAAPERRGNLTKPKVAQQQ